MEETSVVRAIYLWAFQGVGNRQTALKLNELGLQTKTVRKWDRLTVGRFLKDRDDTGEHL